MEDPKSHWFPREPLGQRIQWLLLLLSTFTILTNAYFLRFAEGGVSRKLLASVILAVTGLWMLIRRYGAPRSVAQVLNLLRRHSTPILLGLIVAIAFGLRVWGISSGLPQTYVPDEYDYVHSYLQLIKRGDLNPHWWYHPSLQPYVNVVTFLIVFFLRLPSSSWWSVHQLTVEDMLWWGRLGAGVIPGTLTVVVTFWLAQRLFGKRVGLLAAALLAVFPGAVEVSQYNKPDSLLVMMCSVSVLVSLTYLGRGGGKWAFFSGLAIGLTVAAKYNGALVLLPFVLALLFRNGRRFFVEPDVYAGAGGTILAFVAACPYFIAGLPNFLDHVADGIYTYGVSGLEGAEGVDNWLNHARYTVRYGAGWVSFLAALAGLAVALKRLDARLAVFLTFPVVYYSFYGAQRINFAGNLIPVYPFLAILAAFALFEASRLLVGLLPPIRASRWDPLKAEAWVLTGLLAAAMWFPVDLSVLLNRRATLPDTGSLARQWIDRHFPPGTHFGVERHTAVLDPERYKITMESRIINRAVRDYRAEGVQYLMVSSIVYQRFGPERRQTQNYQKLFNICPLVKEFEPVEGSLIGPTIRILGVPAEDP